jgi:hypothetical protein
VLVGDGGILVGGLDAGLWLIVSLGGGASAGLVAVDESAAPLIHFLSFSS